MSVNQISALERSMYNDEFRVDFEREKSLLMKCVRSDGLMRAGTIYWDVVDPSEEAQERTRDGDIPISALGLSQVSAPPVEYFGGKYKIDDFDAFKSNPNVRQMQYRKAGAACYRRCDSEIITQLDAGTLQTNSGSAIDMTDYGAILDWVSELWDNDVPNDGRVWGVVTPKALAGMQKINEFTSADYVTQRKLEEGLPEQGYYKWLGVNWFSHTGLTGKGTATASNHIFHESAIGHQAAGEPDFHTYYYEPQHRWETYAVMRTATKKVLNNGMVEAVSDDTATYAA